MEQRKLGASDLVVSSVCLGTMTWGEQNTEAEAHAQLDFAWDRGINCMDTGEMYPVPTRAETQGRTEEIISSWLKGRPRDRAVIFGKVTGPSPKSWIPPNRVPAQPAAQTRMDAVSIRGAVETSLRRFGTDYIDLIELHWPERYVGTLFGANAYRRERELDDVIGFDEQVGALARLIEEGKLRAWGLSNETTYGLCRFAEAARALGAPPPVSIQNDFSLTDRSFEPELAEACAPRHLNIGLLAYGALCGGFLTGKYLDEIPARSRHTVWPNFQPRYHSEPVRWATREYERIAAHHGLSTTELALGWAHSRDYVTSVILGATTMEQLAACIDACRVQIPAPALEEIEQQHMRCPNPNKAARAVSPGFVKDVREGI